MWLMYEFVPRSVPSIAAMEHLSDLGMGKDSRRAIPDTLSCAALPADLGHPRRRC